MLTIIKTQTRYTITHHALMLHDNVPQDDSEESKRVAHYCVAVKCCVWRCTLFVFQYQQMAALSIYTEICPSVLRKLLQT